MNVYFARLAGSADAEHCTTTSSNLSASVTKDHISVPVSPLKASDIRASSSVSAAPCANELNDCSRASVSSLRKIEFARTAAYWQYGPVSPSNDNASSKSKAMTEFRVNFSRKYRNAPTAI